MTDALKVALARLNPAAVGGRSRRSCDAGRPPPQRAPLLLEASADGIQIYAREAKVSASHGPSRRPKPICSTGKDAQAQMRYSALYQFYGAAK